MTALTWPERMRVRNGLDMDIVGLLEAPLVPVEPILCVCVCEEKKRESVCMICAGGEY